MDGLRTDGEMGSTARTQAVESLSDGYRDFRVKLKETGVLQAGDDGLLHFTIPYPFDSPSAAAALVTGSGLNGRAHWKVKGEGMTLKDWQEMQVSALPPVVPERRPHLIRPAPRPSATSAALEKAGYF